MWSHECLVSQSSQHGHQESFVADGSPLRGVRIDALLLRALRWCNPDKIGVATIIPDR